MGPTLCLVPVLRSHSWVGETQDQAGPGPQGSGKSTGRKSTGTRPGLALMDHSLVSA